MNGMFIFTCSMFLSISRNFFVYINIHRKRRRIEYCFIFYLLSTEQLLSVQESTTRRKYLMSWNEWHCIVFRQKSGIYNNIKFLKIFIIVFISKLIYVNDRVLVYWQKMEDHPQKKQWYRMRLGLISAT